MIDEDREILLAALRARLDECWDRLDDVVSELVALHEVSAEAIHERVRQTIADKSDAGETGRA